jgi:mannosyl-oligosaccharide alpha-1,2-mannosidase
VRHPVDSYLALPTGHPSPLPRIQHVFDDRAAGNDIQLNSRQQEVKATFERCWKSYRARAWGNDELMPISGNFTNPYGGWGATLVDNLDTLWIMGMEKEFAEAVDAAIGIDFGPKGSEDINVFETIIRYLGGFIAAYDISGCHDERLLQKAVEVGDMVYASFDTPNRMPATRWDPQVASQGFERLPPLNGAIAEMATASVEFTRLSQLTGDMRYFDAISRVTNVLDEQQNRTRLPGMWPIGVNIRKPDLTDGFEFSLGAMSDSAYEYLPKMYQLLSGAGEQASQYTRMYKYAIDTVIHNLLFRPMVEDKADILVSGGLKGGKKDSTGQHLTCFAGGMFVLGGRLVQNNTHVDIGRKLTDGCAWTYRHAPIGIMPDIFTMPACPTLSVCEYIGQAGASPFIKVVNAQYLLRPEAIESVFYMFRITGDAKYQDTAWEMFQAIEKYTRTEFANAALQDVMEGGPGQEDSMESFWMAETLKYFYLIFSDPGTVSLDEFVFNTEAHPFRLRR